jgi:hypothetical protein
MRGEKGEAKGRLGKMKEKMQSPIFSQVLQDPHSPLVRGEKKN